MYINLTTKQIKPRVVARYAEIRAHLRIPYVSPLSCIVTQMDRRGVTVRINHDILIPKRVMLEIPGNMPVRRMCVLVSQINDSVSLKFDHNHQSHIEAFLTKWKEEIETATW